MYGDITTRAEINLEALAHNYKVVKEFVAPAEVMAVVKGDAYGHGAVETVRALWELGCRSFWVAHLDEALELKAAGLKANIHLLGGTTPAQLVTVVQNDIIPFINSEEALIDLEKAARKEEKMVPFHLKIDTGMGRLGLFNEEIPAFCKELARCKWVKLTGVGSHLARASQIHPLNELQIRRFIDAVNLVAAAGPVARHLLASSGTVAFPHMHGDCVRVGRLLYGLYQLDGQLQPVLSLKTTVVQVKELPVDWNIGYGDNMVTVPKRVALLPLGLVDGMTSVLGQNKKASVLIRGQKAPVVSIASDQMIADVTEIAGVVRGDEAVVIGKQGEEEITGHELGLQAESSHGQILMKISRRVPRVYLREGTVKHIKRIYDHRE